MATKDFVVFDSDSHVVEPPALWEKYLDPEYRALGYPPPTLRYRCRDKLHGYYLTISRFNSVTRWTGVKEARAATEH